ncbi:hypothetical protein C772_00867 [Bhargavaea cecembensis DSE10]|uniref:Integral membrane protein n=1 Tax=Bhargavaea cecembensis DSE10 TaxID=1235279 RepID=M7NJ14_9BACL|nr:hypothetical protein C772_00867 [Bhargavaea cecembensis DSE10]
MKKEYKIFYWELDAKGKFIRSLWSGFLALLFLYWAVWFVPAHPAFDNEFFKLWVPIVFTLLYFASLVYKYRKWKKES